jgi:hypothetical protein
VKPMPALCPKHSSCRDWISSRERVELKLRAWTRRRRRRRRRQVVPRCSCIPDDEAKPAAEKLDAKSTDRSRQRQGSNGTVAGIGYHRERVELELLSWTRRRRRRRQVIRRCCCILDDEAKPAVEQASCKVINRPLRTTR